MFSRPAQRLRVSVRVREQAADADVRDGAGGRIPPAQQPVLLLALLLLLLLRLLLRLLLLRLLLRAALRRGKADAARLWAAAWRQLHYCQRPQIVLEVPDGGRRALQRASDGRVRGTGRGGVQR